MSGQISSQDNVTRRTLGNNWDLGYFRARALLVFAVLAALLVMNVVKAEQARTSGAEIILKTRPVDPRDIFFGHYAILSYALNGRDLGELMDSELAAEIDNRPPSQNGQIYITNRQRDPLYVVLEKQGQFHEPIKVVRRAGNVPAGALAMKAYGKPRRSRRCENGARDDDCPFQLRVKTDLPGRYYADRETALAIEDQARNARAQQAAIRTFDRCEAQRERLQTNPDEQVSARCRDVLVRPTENPDDTFGVILSLSEKGDAVIKGLMIGDRRIIDNLQGPRVQLTGS